MIISCPECSVKYQVANSAIPPEGRNVRCAACGHYWFQKSPGSESEGAKKAPPVFEVKKTKIDDDKLNRFKQPPKAPYEKARERSHNKILFSQYAAIIGAWLAVIGVLLGGLGFAINKREAIVRKWPKSASAFAFLGFPANTYELDIQKVEVRSGVDQQGSRLVVAGLIKSNSHEIKTLPYLRVVLIDERGLRRESWLVDPKAMVIAPGATQVFESIKRPMPEGNLRAVVMFASEPKTVKNGAGVVSAENGNLMGDPANHASPEEKLSHMGDGADEEVNSQVSGHNPSEHEAAKNENIQENTAQNAPSLLVPNSPHDAEPAVQIAPNHTDNAEPHNNHAPAH